MDVSGVRGLLRICQVEGRQRISSEGPSKETVMKKMLVAVALAVVSLTIAPAPTNVRTSDRLSALPAPPIEPICIVIWGQKICW